MTVIRAKILGYCMGVKRAVETASNALKENDSVYTLGPLIHNPKVLSSLEKDGLKILNAESVLSETGDFPPLEKSVVVIRAHGTTPEVLASLESHGAKVLDATCPRVHLSQRRAAEWAQKGYSVIIAGDRNHGEVTSISAYAEHEKKNSVCVVQNAMEAEKLSVEKNTILIAQTTFSPGEFERITQVLKEKNPELVVFNSICSATMERQKALAELKGSADGILVIGGKNSANTIRLYETASAICERAALIEDESEIPEDFFALGTVALTAGASTPTATVDSVEKALLDTAL